MYIRNRIKIEMIFIQCFQAQKGRIKMNKKLLSLFITAAMLTPAMSALADDVELISAPETVFETETAAPAMNKLTGVVASVENGIANITIADGELTADYGFGITEDSAIFTIDGKEVTELKAGDNVIVFTESSLKTKDIKTATAIVILSEENTDTNVMLSTFTNTEDGFLSADGELVIYHDKDLSRLTACDKDVEELTLAEIKELSLDGTEHKIPTFKEFLMFVDGKVPLVIEFKSEKLKCPTLCEKADEILREYSGIYSVQSFDPYVVYWYKKHRPEIFRGQLGDVYKDTFIRWLLSTFLYNFLTRPDYIAFSCEKGDS